MSRTPTTNGNSFAGAAPMLDRLIKFYFRNDVQKWYGPVVGVCIGGVLVWVLSLR